MGGRGKVILKKGQNILESLDGTRAMYAAVKIKCKFPKNLNGGDGSVRPSATFLMPGRKLRTD